MFEDEEEEEDNVDNLAPRRFKPKAGIRDRLRSRLQDVLEKENEGERYGKVTQSVLVKPKRLHQML